jgi:hypothetical protein
MMDYRSRKFVKRGQIDNPRTEVRDRSLSWFGTDTSIKCGGVKLVLWDQAYKV